MSVLPREGSPMDDNNIVQQTQTGTPTPAGKFGTFDFWAELVIKQGVSALIAVYLVYSITGQQQQTLQRIEQSLSQLGLKLDRISDKLTK